MLSPELRLWKWELRKGDRVEILHGYLISLDEVGVVFTDIQIGSD